MAVIWESKKTLEERYGAMLRLPPYSETTSAYYWHQALSRRVPPVNVTHATVKEWWKVYREGVHTELLTYARVNFIPSSAIRSRFGVYVSPPNVAILDGF